VVLVCFSKMTYFIPCHKIDYVSNITKIFLRDVLKLHGLPKTIVLNRDPKFTFIYGGHSRED